MAYIKKITFDKVGKNEGCVCDRCGQYIQNIWTVEYTDGVIMHFGIDCFEKLSKGKLTTYGMKVMKKALSKIQDWSEILEQWKNGEITEDNCESWKTEQADWNDSYWKGHQFEEYKEWMINDFIPVRLDNAQKEINKFQKINFER